MGSRVSIRVFVFSLLLMASTGSVSAAEATSTLDFVSEDAAFCLEIPHLDETWTSIESGSVLGRLRTTSIYQRILESRGFQQLQTIENHIAQLTGRKLSAQLRSLFAKSLVMAIYVPPTGNPRGILIGEAVDAAAIETALSTLKKLEPNVVTSFKTHHGVRYQQRKKSADAAENIFMVTSGPWFAVSDQEGLIHDIIDRFERVARQPGQSPAGSLGQSPTFVRNRQRLKSAAAAFLHINARPWDRGLEEAKHDPHDPIQPVAIWKHVNAVSACLDLNSGVVCDLVVELDTGHLPTGWSQFVATAAADPTWMKRIPPEALMAFSGHLELTPLVRLFLNQIPEKDQAELEKNRRIAQSILGGHEFLETVLPALAKGFSGSVVTRKDEKANRIVIDGSVAFALTSPEDAKMLPGIADGLETGLNLLAAFFSAKGPQLVTVEREQSATSQLRWLSNTAPVPAAFGVKGNHLLVAGSNETLRRSLDTIENGVTKSRLMDHAQRFFPQASQLIWFDAAQVRQTLEKNGLDLAQFFAHGSAEESSRLSSRFDHVRQMLGVIDSVFIAGRIESDHVRVTFGGGLDRE